MMWVGHVLDHVPNRVLDHMIIGLVTTALYCGIESINHLFEVFLKAQIFEAPNIRSTIM